ncbi:TonB-dependent receptor [Sphingomonas bacterium]|uniref:TonB-dependent receptor n=1 Tax=Sphingomonas bacterium TaxID=1895847 RepID=UPI0015759CBD|nr:TonB-dependent receptor [Sphingomonas bacterium]
MNHRYRLLSGFAAMLPGLMLSTAVQAQTTVGTTVPATASPDAGQATPARPGEPAVPPTIASGQDTTDNATTVGEIVVTAQKRSENLQRVPIVITAVSGAQLATAGVTGLTQLGAVTPGLTVRTTAGAVFQPAIRGVGTSSNVVENPVALYIDGVYLAQQREGNRELPDVEQVAILKGPQGTLFGRNATGGVIQITTRRPSEQFTGEAKVEIDNYATFRASGFVSGGLAHGVAASLSADVTTQGEGYGKNLTTGHDTFQVAHAVSVRGKLLFDIDAKTSVLFIADYLDRKDYTYSFVPYPGTSFSVPLPGPLPSPRDTYSSIDPYASFRGGGVSMTIDHDLDFAKLVSITAYREGRSDYLFEDVPAGQNVFQVGVPSSAQPNRQFSEEVQLVSEKNGPVTYTAGVFYFYNRNANVPVLRQFFPVFYGNPPAAVLANLNQTTVTYGSEQTQSVAPFGQLGIRLFEGTHLTLGGRFTYEQRTLTGQLIANHYNGVSPVTNYNPPALTINKPTWRIALDHQFGPDILGYVSYNRGIKSGGFNILTPSNPAYLPERLDAYEAGLKTELFDHRLRLNAGGFYYDYTNLQVIQFVGVSQTIVNGAKARLYGLDVDFTARATPELTLSGGLEALHARFVSYLGAVGSIPKPAGGATLISVDASGNRIPLAQKFAGTLAMDYEKPVSFGTIHANVTANYNGDYKIEADNFLTQKAYTLLNASLAWRPQGDRFEVKIWARNMLDELVLNNTSSQAPGYPTSYGTPPRTFGMTGKVHF